MRILVAEDQPELRRMLVKNLTAAGYTVDGVPDGEEALAYLDATAWMPGRMTISSSPLRWTSCWRGCGC